MELTMQVEPTGWGWLTVTGEQVSVRLRASYVSDVLTKVVGVIADAANGAGSAQALLGLEPGGATFSIERRDEAWSILSVQVSEDRRAQGGFEFRVRTASLARLGLGLAASVDREAYLESWSQQGTWPTEALARLHHLASQA
ncbi:hypothetical protein [Nocardioides sp. CER19]|uniref:hypothetical protein n=1 Tax=Nocardioides sp. CER19 TaxID=3038538 RepID=UPI00244AC4D3|nr:hypothetical protein [Nocardioides sp. CER19]MDH2413951.1 hypothetical protein [Nocardioides sp. CER19]